MSAIDLDPLSLLYRLAAAVPAPGFNTVRYGGVLGPAAQMRPLLISKLAAPGDPADSLLAKADTLAPFIIGTTKNEWVMFQAIGSPKYNTVAELQSAIESQFGESQRMISVRRSPTALERIVDRPTRHLLVSDDDVGRIAPARGKP